MILSDDEIRALLRANGWQVDPLFLADTTRRVMETGRAIERAAVEKLIAEADETAKRCANYTNIDGRILHDSWSDYAYWLRSKREG